MLSVLPLVLIAVAPTPVQTELEIVRRSLVTLGDTARLQRVLAKARSGGKIVVGVIGGSITQGAVASAEGKRWGNLVADWWRATFPKAKVEFVNAGIGATGSDIGAHRVALHLLAKHPDFVVTEFGVNDPNTELAAETLEGIVRQVLGAPNRPAMMLLFTMHSNGTNAQEWHGKVGRHYGLPMVSFRDALWPEIEAKRLRWEDVEGDIVHPNDRGHAYCARFVTSALEEVMRTTSRGRRLPAVAPLPKPLVSDVFERAEMHGPDNASPLRSDGWERRTDDWAFGSYWTSRTPGSVLELDVEGSTIGLVYYRIKGAMGRADVRVDDRPPVVLEGWFDQDWGGYDACQIVARELGPGKHRVRVSVLQDRAAASTGSEFRVVRVLAAGGAVVRPGDGR